MAVKAGTTLSQESAAACFRVMRGSGCSTSVATAAIHESGHLCAAMAFGAVPCSAELFESPANGAASGRCCGLNCCKQAIPDLDNRQRSIFGAAGGASVLALVGDVGVHAEVEPKDIRPGVSRDEVMREATEFARKHETAIFRVAQALACRRKFVRADVIDLLMNDISLTSIRNEFKKSPKGAR